MRNNAKPMKTNTTNLKVKPENKKSGFSLIFDLLILGAFLYLLVLFLPSQLGGTKTYVITAGTSMLPDFVRGDLVITKKQDNYHVGEAVLYKDQFIPNIFHRIVDLDSTKFVLQGDNNDWLDTYRPTKDEIKGALWIHIPGVGNFVEKLKTPVGIAITALVLSIIVISSTGIIHFSDEENIESINEVKTKETIMQKQDVSFFNRFSDTQVSILSFVGILFMLAGFLTILGFSKPHEYTTNVEIRFTHKGQFSYTGTADPSIFDSDTLQPGEPIFQQTNDSFDVIYDYEFSGNDITNTQGTYSLSLVLSSQNGWQKTIQMITDEPFEGSEIDITGTVDLIEIRNLLEDVQEKTGIRSSNYVMKIDILVMLSSEITEIPITEIHSEQFNFSYGTTQITLAQPLNTLTISEPQYLLKQVDKRSTVQIPFIGITVDTYQLRVIGIGSLSIVTSILLYLLFVWSRTYDKPINTDIASTPMSNQELSGQGFINELGFENIIEEIAEDVAVESVPEFKETPLKEITEEQPPLVESTIDEIFTTESELNQTDEQEIFTEEEKELLIEQPALEQQKNAYVRRSSKQKHETSLTPEDLEILLNEKHIIEVESLNLEDYNVVSIGNQEQILNISQQENAPIYHFIDDKDYKFIITLPEKKIGYIFSTKISG